MAEHGYDEWAGAYAARFAVAKRTATQIEGPCPLCGGDDRFNLKQGATAVIARCWQCSATFTDFLQELFPPDPDWRPDRAETPDPAPAPYGCTLVQLAARTALPLDWLRDTLGWSDARCFIDAETGEVPSVRIPYRDEAGELVSAKHRVRESGKDKYRYERGSRAMLYGLDWLDVARGAGKVVVVEGETDAATLWRHEIPALGVPGASACKVILAEHMQGIRRVYVIEERDDAGEAFVGGVAARLAEIGSEAAVLRVQLQAKDASDSYLADPERFLGRLIHACTYARGLRPSRLDRRSIISVRDLCRREFPAVRHIIPGLLPEGIALLFAAPKVGKSFLALQMAVSVGTGTRLAGLEGWVDQAEVLVIDREQPIGGGMQARYRAHEAHEAQHGIMIADEWPRIGEGGLDELDIWLSEHPDCRLVVVDVYSSIKPLRTPPGTNAYDHEYSVLTRLRDLMQRRSACVLLVHHDRKGLQGGITESPSGSKAVTGTANALLWLRREVGERDGSLTVTGRDVEEMELAARFAGGRWELTAADAAGW